ncbi:MAG: hypothetical protein M0R46_00280 [Candidatus Muirbacterium halophilum]|nr:hypothetical protein [Candidatus Muirbacterium halophilum]MCK9474329.1 hypothetical protein [Candidatus Muirbacterium halophilum]
MKKITKSDNYEIVIENVENKRSWKKIFGFFLLILLINFVVFSIVNSGSFYGKEVFTNAKKAILTDYEKSEINELIKSTSNIYYSKVDNSAERMFREDLELFFDTKQDNLKSYFKDLIGYSTIYHYTKGKITGDMSGFDNKITDIFNETLFEGNLSASIKKIVDENIVEKNNDNYEYIKNINSNIDKYVDC